MPKLLLPATIERIGEGIDFIEQTLKSYNIKKRTMLETMLISEEALVRLIEHAPNHQNFEISIKRWYNTATITISLMGKAFQNEELQIDLADTSMSHDSEENIRSILLRAYANKINYYRRGNYNFVRIHVGSRHPVWVAQTILAFLLAFLISFVLRTYFPKIVSTHLLQTILLPFQNAFLNALQLVTAPAIFFAIVSVVAEYASFSDLGKINIKVIVGYFITSILSVLSAILLYHQIHPFSNSTGMFKIYVNTTTTISANERLFHTLNNVIPNNIITPFMNADALQLLIMAVLGGIALGRAGHYSPMLKEIADAMNRFFTECVNIVSQMIPAAVLLLTILISLSFKEYVIIISLKILGMTVLGIAVMFLCYILMIMILGRINPIPFFRKCAYNIFHSFFDETGENIISNTMRMCERKLGISKALYSFSIPFGALANMDGSCVFITMAGLSIAQLCGVEFLGEHTITTFFMVFLLSIGSSITPASGLLAITMITSQLNIDPVVLNVLVGLTVIIEIFISIMNNIGDVAITLIVAKNEGMINMDVYNE